MKRWILIMLSIVGSLSLTVSCKKERSSTSGNKAANVIYSDKYIPENPNNNPGDPGNPIDNSGLIDPYTFYIDLPANESWTSPEIETDNVLDIAFVPSLNMNGNIHAYSRLAVKITANGRSEVTPGLRISEYSTIFNFSGRVGNGRVRIRVGEPAYDFYCINWGLGCPLKGMYDPNSQTDFTRVKWAGRILIGTNDTKRLADALYNMNLQSYDPYRY